MTDHLTYGIAKAIRDNLERENRAASQAIRDAFPNRNEYGATRPEDPNQLAEWREMRAVCDQAHRALANHNRMMVRRFKAEMKQERDRRYD